jgi:hypothetical protein
LALVAKSTFGLRSPTPAAVQPLQADAVRLTLPLQSIYLNGKLKSMLPTSYRIRKPTILYSPAHARSAALASINSSPIDIGRHLASIAMQHLQQAGGPYPAYAVARILSFTANSRIAQLQAIQRPAGSELRARLNWLKP